MESEDALLELLSQAVARKHVVEVRPSTFRYGSTNSEKVTSGDLRSETYLIYVLLSCLTHDPVAVSTLMVLVGRDTSISLVTLASDGYCHSKIYDWLLILPQEVKYIWCASWNYTKVLYLVARYAPFISVSLMIRSEFLFPLLTHLPARFHFPSSS